MTKKAWIYSGVGAVVLVAGYFNYFGEDKKLDTLKKVIETSNAIYKSADYFVEAKKQIDYVDDKETKFEIAKAVVKGMALSGDNVVIDKLRNLVLKNNILGVSETDGNLILQNYDITSPQMKLFQRQGYLLSMRKKEFI